MTSIANLMIVWLVVSGSSIGGAFLMNHFASGAVSAGFGMAGGAIVGFGLVLVLAFLDAE